MGFFRQYEASVQSAARTSWTTVSTIYLRRLNLVLGQVVSGKTVAGPKT